MLVQDRIGSRPYCHSTQVWRCGQPRSSSCNAGDRGTCREALKWTDSEYHVGCFGAESPVIQSRCHRQQFSWEGDWKAQELLGRPVQPAKER